MVKALISEDGMPSGCCAVSSRKYANIAERSRSSAAMWLMSGDLSRAVDVVGRRFPMALLRHSRTR
jgi:hypothetical protein